MVRSVDLDIGQLANRYTQAWLSHDPSAVVALHSEDSIFESHGRSGEIRGREALLPEFAKIFEIYPSLGAEELRLYPGHRHWTLEWRLTFQRPNEDRQAIRALDLVEVNDEGLVTRKDTYFDMGDFQAAFGAPK